MKTYVKIVDKSFLKFKYVRESSMTSFSHFSMREKEDKLIANFIIDRSALWVDRKSSKFEIKGFNDKILLVLYLIWKILDKAI